MSKISGKGIHHRAMEKRWADEAKQGEALRAAAGRSLKALEAKRGKSSGSGAGQAKKPKKGKGKSKGPKRYRDDGLAPGDRMMVDQLVSPEAQRHGDYRPVDFKIESTGQRDKAKEKSIRVIRNLGGTPVERWHARGALDERQMAAILFYQNAWRLWMGEPRVVANWGALIVRAASGAAEIYAGSRIAAKESLRLLDQEVFFRLPIEHFQVFQNVVIWDEPGGVAGGRAGFCHKPAEAVARVIVATCASMIADIVIDSARKDFEGAHLDLDAPRRAGRRR